MPSAGVHQLRQVGRVCNFVRGGVRLRTGHGARRRSAMATERRPARRDGRLRARRTSCRGTGRTQKGTWRRSLPITPPYGPRNDSTPSRVFPKPSIFTKRTQWFRDRKCLWMGLWDRLLGMYGSGDFGWVRPPQNWVRSGLCAMVSPLDFGLGWAISRQFCRGRV